MRLTSFQSRVQGFGIQGSGLSGLGWFRFQGLGFKGKGSLLQPLREHALRKWERVDVHSKHDEAPQNCSRITGGYPKGSI